MKVVTPQYTAEVLIAFESDKKNSPSLQSGLQDSVSVPLLDLDFSRPKNSNSISKITGETFLSDLLKQEVVANEVEKHCKYSPPRIMSLTGALEFLGIVRLNQVNSDQKTRFKVQCIQSWLRIMEYTYNGLKTEAHLISIKHEDPAFAAFLVNEIINYFSKASRQEKIEKKIETLDYLSRALAKAEIEKTKGLGNERIC